MITKGIGASTHIDAHNHKFTKEALETMKNSIKNGKYACAIKIEHDLTVMPIGKIIDADVIELSDGEYGLSITQEIFDEILKYNKIGKTWYVQKSLYDNRPFSENIDSEEIKKITVSIDQTNFIQEDFKKLMNLYRDDFSLNTKILIRKSLIPNPEIIINLVTGTFLMMAVKKATDRITDKMADDLSKIYDLIKKIILNTVKYFINKDKPTTYVFVEKNEYILEFIVISQEPNILFEALNLLFRTNINEKIDDFLMFFHNNIDINDISKMQFLYNSELKKWELYYINTITGLSIGSEKCYNHTQTVFQEYKKNMKDKNN